MKREELISFIGEEHAQLICERFGGDRHYIPCWEVKPPGGNNRRDYLALREQAEKMFLNGVHVQAVSEGLAIHWSTAYRWRREAGLSKNNRKEQNFPIPDGDGCSHNKNYID